MHELFHLRDQFVDIAAIEVPDDKKIFCNTYAGKGSVGNDVKIVSVFLLRFAKSRKKSQNGLEFSRIIKFARYAQLAIVSRRAFAWASSEPSRMTLCKSRVTLSSCRSVKYSS